MSNVKSNSVVAAAANATASSPLLGSPPNAVSAARGNPVAVMSKTSGNQFMIPPNAKMVDASSFPPGVSAQDISTPTRGMKAQPHMFSPSAVIPGNVIKGRTLKPPTPSKFFSLCIEFLPEFFADRALFLLSSYVCSGRRGHQSWPHSVVTVNGSASKQS